MACDGSGDGFKQKERTQRWRDRIKKRQKDEASRRGCLKRGVEAFRAVTARRYCIFIRRSITTSFISFRWSFTSLSRPLLYLPFVAAKDASVKVARGRVNDDAITERFRSLFRDNSIFQFANRFKRRNVDSKQFAQMRRVRVPCHISQSISVELSIKFVDTKFCSGGPIIDEVFYLLSAICWFLNNRFFVLLFEERDSEKYLTRLRMF